MFAAAIILALRDRNRDSSRNINIESADNSDDSYRITPKIGRLSKKVYLAVFCIVFANFCI